MMVRFGEIKGIEKWKAYLKTVPRGVTRTALRAIVEWVIGTPERGLKRYSPYKYVSRLRAYGKTFVSPKQRGYVMAKIREGRIDPGYPHRTGNTQRGYIAVESNNGYRQSIQNKTAGAYYTRSDEGQAKLNALAGWRKAMDVISTNIDGALRHARAAVNMWLKSQKP